MIVWAIKVSLFHCDTDGSYHRIDDIANTWVPVTPFY